ncbi:hypothetical protein CW713_08575 [Methanophagales archaeon]|nr:MAG: hypothetical protein CW713_08575 [Methanophagales archaeon]
MSECLTFALNSTIKSQDLWRGMQGSVLVVKTDLIENDPETVRKLVRVTQKATNWVNENPDRTSIILANLLDTKPEVINRSMSRLNYTTDIDAESVQETIDYMAKSGYIEKGLKAEDILDTMFLRDGRYEN